MLNDRVSPRFGDHFPRLAEGHGATGKHTDKKGKVVYCQVATCECNRDTGKGDKHINQKSNMFNWIDAVGYSGPDHGYTREARRERRDEGVTGPKHRCHKDCKRFDRHSTCFASRGFSQTLGSQLAAKVENLGTDLTRQQSRMFIEYANVEETWKEAQARLKLPS